MAAYIWIPEGATDLEISFTRPGHVPGNVSLGGQAMNQHGPLWRRLGQLPPGLHEFVANDIDRELGFLIEITTAQSRGQGQGNGGQGQGNQP